MARKNRVDPSGHLSADPARAGTLMGNRGRLHDKDRNIVHERKAEKRWIACTMNEIFGRRDQQVVNTYTELFFLDEATSLAAGHRPCNDCRPQHLALFRKAWAAAGLPQADSVKTIDALLDLERFACTRETISPVGLPGGVIIRSVDDGQYYIVHQSQLFPWSFSGYGPGRPITEQSGVFELITPPSIVRVLAAGYRPAPHISLPNESANFAG